MIIFIYLFIYFGCEAKVQVKKIKNVTFLSAPHFFLLETAPLVCHIILVGLSIKGPLLWPKVCMLASRDNQSSCSVIEMETGKERGPVCLQRLRLSTMQKWECQDPISSLCGESVAENEADTEGHRGERERMTDRWTSRYHLSTWIKLYLKAWIIILKIR